MVQQTRFLFLSDWDGTITTRDSNDFLTDENGLGPVRRAELNRAVLDQVLPFRDAFKQSMYLLQAAVQRAEPGEQCWITSG